MLNLGSHSVRVGDTARFPLGQLGDEQVYNRTWEAVAFVKGCVVAKRRHDGLERTVSAYWWDRYQREDHGPLSKGLQDGHSERLAALRARRLADARANRQTEPTQPGYYVSARKGPQYALLLGPFRDHYTALQMVETCWPLVRRYDDPFGEIAVGTCRAETSERIGKFNAEVLGD